VDCTAEEECDAGFDELPPVNVFVEGLARAVCEAAYKAVVD